MDLYNKEGEAGKKVVKMLSQDFSTDKWKSCLLYTSDAADE